MIARVMRGAWQPEGGPILFVVYSRAVGQIGRGSKDRAQRVVPASSKEQARGSLQAGRAPGGALGAARGEAWRCHDRMGHDTI